MTTVAKTLAEFERAFLRDYAERKVQRQNVRRAEEIFHTLRRDLGVDALAQLDDDEITGHFEQVLVGRGLAPGSRLTWQKALRTVRASGVKWGYLKRQPRPLTDTSHPKWIELHGRPDVGTPLSAREISLLRRTLRELSKSFDGGRDYLIAELALHHGVKPMQALALRPGDVGPGQSSITLRGRDGTRPKYVRLSPHLQDFMRDWLEQPRVKEEDLIFPGKQRGAWTYHTWYADRPSVRLKGVCKAAGIREITFNLILHHYTENYVTALPGIESDAAPGDALTQPKRKPRPKREPSFVITGTHDNVFVFGIDQGVLPSGQYAVFKTLVDAGPDGVEASKIVSVSGYGRAAKLVKELQDRSPEFGELIYRPGRGYIGQKGVYRIRIWFMDER